MKRFILILMLAISCLAYSEENLSDNIQQRSTEESNTAINISFLNGKLSIENAPINSTVEIFSMLGVSVFHDVVTDVKQYFLLDLNKGYYIIKIAGITKKISVK